MKIAIDGRTLTDEKRTGVGTYTYEIIKALAEAAPGDHFFIFISGSAASRGRVPQFKSSNISIFQTGIPNKLLNLALALPFSPISLDAFLPTHVDAWFFPNHGVLSTKRPYLFTVHDLSFLHFPQFFSKKDRIVRAIQGIPELMKNAGQVITPSRATARDVIQAFHLPADRVSVSPLGVDPTRFAPREQPSDRTFRAAYDLNRPYILFAATLEPRKNVESVIEAYDLFRTRGGEAFPLVIMGKNGFLAEKIKKTAKAALFHDDIRFLGFVPEKHKPALFRGASAFLFPSFYEGFGLPVLEAMASGVPVITSFTSSMPEIGSDAVLYVDPFNVEDLARGLSILFDPSSGKPVRDSMKKRGISTAKAFTWKNTAKITLAALKTLTE